MDCNRGLALVIGPSTAVASVLIAASLALGGAVYFEFVGEVPPVAAAVRRVEMARPSPPVEAQDTRRLTKAMLGRPLFAPNRRPHTETAPLAVASAAAAPPLLAGTLIAGGTERFALVVVPSAERVLAVREGDMVGKFKVIRIGPGELLADGPDGAIALRIQARSTPHEQEEIGLDPRHPGPPGQDE